MIYPHVIRLRGPWHFEVLPADDRDAPDSRGIEHSQATQAASAPRPAGSAPLPHDWTTGIERPAGARLCWRRRFSRPTNLDPGEAVWLCVVGRGATLAVALNGDYLGTVATEQPVREFDVTSRLTPRNELTIDVHRPADAPPGQTSSKAEVNVRLEVRRAV